ncbi:kinesin family member 1/13/14 [Clonorchis sinensis]|uniref:Kinesin family member 1/13/14 n=1 Tax=Clonorchis sinensis TaxID=79923 RepID=G7Y8B9_CLOSI|nr:kinesin family member 1/13/14 [Clonorchis sinensis]
MCRIHAVGKVEKSRHLLILREALKTMGRLDSQLSLDRLIVASRQREYRQRQFAAQFRRDTIKDADDVETNSDKKGKDDKHSDSGLAASTITTTDSVNLETHDPIQLGMSHSRLTRSAEYKTDARLYTLDPLSGSFFEWDGNSLVQGSPKETRKQLMMSRCVEVLTSLLQMTNKLLSPGELSGVDFNQEQPGDGAESETNSQSGEDRTWPKILEPAEIDSSNPSNSQTHTEENFEVHQSVTMDSLQLPSVKDTGRIPRLIGECDEVRVSPVVSRKGYLLVLEEKTGGWLRRWAVVRRPFLYLYETEQDPTERCLINLTTSQLEYDINVAFASDLSPQSLNGHQGSLSKNTAEETKLPPTEVVSSRSNMFTLITQQHTFLIQTLADGGSDVHDWLYALNPLMAGEIRTHLERFKSIGFHPGSPEWVGISKVCQFPKL